MGVVWVCFVQEIKWGVQVEKLEICCLVTGVIRLVDCECGC